MPLSRFIPRFTVRRLMVVVGLVGLALGMTAEGIRLRGLSLAYRERAAFHGREARRMDQANLLVSRQRMDAERSGIPDPRAYLGLGPRIKAPYPFLNSLNERRKIYFFRSNWHEKMKAKYERAASQPWRTVEADTREPE